MRIKICAICGKEFSPTHGREKYCSSECRLIAVKNYNKKYAANNKEKIKLRCKLWRENNPEKYKEGLKKAKIRYLQYKEEHPILPKNCALCGKEFTPTNRSTIYCSSECAMLAGKQRFQEYYNRNKEKHNKVCSEYNKTHREECRNALRKFHENNPGKQAEYTKRYEQKRAAELGISVKEFRAILRNKYAANKGMTTAEYDKYVYEQRMERYASKLRMPATEFKKLYNAACYYKCKIWEMLNMTETEYKEIINS